MARTYSEDARTTGLRWGSARGTGRGVARPASALRRFLSKPMSSFYLVMMLTFALVAFGLVMLASASAVDSLQTYGSAWYQFNKQLIFAVAGVAAMIVAMRIPLARWRALSPMLMVASIALLVLVLIPGIGEQRGGARRWFDIGGVISLQPSELAKVAFLLWGAHVLVQRRKILITWEGLLKPILPGLVLLCGLVVIEPDLHTTATYLIIFLGLLWVVGAPFRIFGLMLLGVLALGVVAIATQGFRVARLLAFLDPWADAQDGGHQAIQGFYALATGGFFGVGLGNSRTKWGALPNAHSDYIFAIIGEELGFIGCLLVLVLFGLLAYSGLRIASRAKDPFIQLVAGATAVWMVGQALINIGYVVGLLPVTGITLPLISSGGTSLVVTMFTMGILASCARHEPAAVRHLQSRARRFGRWLSLPVPRSPLLAADRTPARARTRSQRPRTTAARGASAARSEPPRRGKPAERRSAPGARTTPPTQTPSAKRAPSAKRTPPERPAPPGRRTAATARAQSTSRTPERRTTAPRRAAYRDDDDRDSRGRRAR